MCEAKKGDDLARVNTVSHLSHHAKDYTHDVTILCNITVELLNDSASIKQRMNNDFENGFKRGAKNEKLGRKYGSSVDGFARGISQIVNAPPGCDTASLVRDVRNSLVDYVRYKPSPTDSQVKQFCRDVGEVYGLKLNLDDGLIKLLRSDDKASRKILKESLGKFLAKAVPNQNFSNPDAAKPDAKPFGEAAREYVNRLTDEQINYQASTTNGSGKLADSLLHLAAKAGELELVSQLLQRGANLAAVNGDNKTPLNITDLNGNTLLHHAAKAGNVLMVKLLVDRGADMQAANKDGKTPVALAKDAGNKMMAQQFRRMSESKSLGRVREMHHNYAANAPNKRPREEQDQRRVIKSGKVGNLAQRLPSSSPPASPESSPKPQQKEAEASANKAADKNTESADQTESVSSISPRRSS